MGLLSLSQNGSHFSLLETSNCITECFCWEREAVGEKEVEEEGRMLLHLCA